MNANEFCRALTPRFVTVGGVRTHYIECGQGRPVVLLHGLSASFWNWWRNIPALSKQFKIIAYDLKGCGRSDKPRDTYTTTACIAQLTGLLDHLGIERATFVGHSMGARIALHLAIEAQHRVDALVLVSPSCYPQTVGRAVRWLILPGIGEVYTWLLYTGRSNDLVRRALQYCTHPQTTVSDEDVYWNMISGAEQKRHLARTYLSYGRHMRFHLPWELAQRYSEINVPALVISGNDDRFVPKEHVVQLAQTLPQAQLALWPDTGHLPHTEHTERFNTLVSAFLNDCDPTHRHSRMWFSRLISRDRTRKNKHRYVKGVQKEKLFGVANS